jgi:hypothetical protein
MFPIYSYHLPVKPAFFNCIDFGWPTESIG